MLDGEQGLEQSRVLSTLRTAAPAARQYLSQNALKMSDPTFDSIDKGIKANHAREVTDARQSHEGIAAAPGAVLEALILRAQNASGERGWLSSETIQCRLVKTSEYDDFCGGVDFVMTFTKDDGTLLLALAVDATQGSKSQDEKLEKITDSIRNKESKSVAYFANPTSGFSGQLKDVPMFLSVFDAAHVAEVETLRQEKGDAALHDHPAQIMFLTQLSVQARTLSQFARDTHGESNNPLYQKYAQADKIISQVLREKLKEKHWPAWGRNDKAWSRLSQNLSRLEQSSKSSQMPQKESDVIMSTGVRGGNPRPVLVERKKNRRIDRAA